MCRQPAPLPTAASAEEAANAQRPTTAPQFNNQLLELETVIAAQPVAQRVHAIGKAMLAFGRQAARWARRGSQARLQAKDPLKPGALAQVCGLRAASENEAYKEALVELLGAHILRHHRAHTALKDSLRAIGCACGAVSQLGLLPRESRLKSCRGL